MTLSRPPSTPVRHPALRLLRAAPLLAPVAGVVLACLVAAAPAAAGGFEVDDQGAAAAGMGGAFTAVADDATAIFYNPGGLAFLDKGEVAAGAAPQLLNQATFRGASGSSAAGTTGEQDDVLTVPAHVYAVKPFGRVLRLGVGAFTPFRLEADWNPGPPAFPGRFVATEASLSAYELNPTLALSLGRLGVGIGVVARFSEVSLDRRFQRPDPLDSSRLLEVADLAIDGDLETGFGFNAGFLHRPSAGFAWGATYRSAIDVDHAGEGTLTQVSTGDDQLDEIFARVLPFDDPLGLEVTVDYPARATFGVAIGSGERVRFAADVGWTGWSDLQALDFVFAPVAGSPDLASDLSSPLLVLGLDDSLTYRLGLDWQTIGGSHFRVGASYSETPQPEETLSPVLADADRIALTLGFGRDWLDLAVGYVDWDERATRGNLFGLDGTYDANAVTLAVTVSR